MNSKSSIVLVHIAGAVKLWKIMFDNSYYSELLIYHACLSFFPGGGGVIAIPEGLEPPPGGGGS